MKIKSISREKFSGEVYNIELQSNSKEDDLFWIEADSGIITHNCFPKDMGALLHLANSHGIGMPTIAGAQITNMIVRQDRDWEAMEGRAVSTRPESEIEKIEE